MRVDNNFKANIPLNSNNVYIYNNYEASQDESNCGHAMLIVGYDNTKNAFKIINSWGTNWGDNGYSWVNYNFFLPQDDVNYTAGFNGAYVAYDED